MSECTFTEGLKRNSIFLFANFIFNYVYFRVCVCVEGWYVEEATHGDQKMVSTPLNKKFRKAVSVLILIVIAAMVLTMIIPYLT